MPIYEIVQRIDVGNSITPMLRKMGGGTESLIYTGPKCVSLEQALAMGLAALKGQYAPRVPKKADEAIKECAGYGLPEAKGT